MGLLLFSIQGKFLIFLQKQLGMSLFITCDWISLIVKSVLRPNFISKKLAGYESIFELQMEIMFELKQIIGYFKWLLHLPHLPMRQYAFS